jgi:hypothetical protein
MRQHRRSIAGEVYCSTGAKEWTRPCLSLNCILATSQVVSQEHSSQWLIRGPGPCNRRGPHASSPCIIRHRTRAVRLYGVPLMRERRFYIGSSEYGGGGFSSSVPVVGAGTGASAINLFCSSSFTTQSADPHAVVRRKNIDKTGTSCRSRATVPNL